MTRPIPVVLIAGGLLLAADAGLAQTPQPTPADRLAGAHVLRLPPAYQRTDSTSGGGQTPPAPQYSVQRYGPVDGANLRQVPAAPTPYGTAAPQNTPYPPPSYNNQPQPAPSPYGPASHYGGGSLLGNPQQYQQPQVQTPNYGDQGQQRPGYGYAPPQGQTPGYGYAPQAPQVQTPNYGGQPPVQAQQPQGGDVPPDDATASREQPPPSSSGFGPAGQMSPPSGSQVPSGGLSAPVTQSPLTPLQPAEPAQTAPPQLGIPNPSVPPSETPAAPEVASPQTPAPAQPGTPPAGGTPANTVQQPAPGGDQGTAAQGTPAQGTASPAPQGATPPAPQGATPPAPQGATPPAPQGTASPAPQGATPPGSTQPSANAYAPAPPWPNQWLPAGTATLQALDKVNAQTQTLTVKVGQSATFGSLTIAVKSCVVRPPDQPSDAAAFVSVTDSHPDSEGFNGWLLENEPTVSIMQHPIYDLRVTGCA